MTPTVNAFELANRLSFVLEKASIPYAIGGAIALGAWSDPRGTLDVDINLFVSGDELGIALDALVAEGVEIDREAALRAEKEGDVIIGYCEALRVDLFTPSIPFSWEAKETSVRLRGPSGEASYLSREALAVFKLLFFRGKDIVDLEKLLAVQGKALDAPYVRRWIVDMMGEDDQRVAVWDGLVERYWISPGA